MVVIIILDLNLFQMHSSGEECGQEVNSTDLKISKNASTIQTKKHVLLTVGVNLLHTGVTQVTAKFFPSDSTSMLYSLFWDLENVTVVP